METGWFNSANGINRIQYYVLKPKGEPRAILQISHGMREYFQRYEEFAAFLNEQGILVCGNDHLGHGNSISTEEDLGYFAPKDGWKFLIEDLHRVTELVKAEYPGVPYFLFGHSMGSFIARGYLSFYEKELSGVILMGTSGRNAFLPLSFPIVDTMIHLRGDHYRSLLIHRIAFGTYNVRVKPKRTEYDWLSKDENVVDRFKADKKCTFVFTLSGFRDLFFLLKVISSKKWAKEMDRDLPIFLLSGGMDPVGAYGKGVKEVHDKLALAGVKDLVMKLYPNCRHELLNETNRQTVYTDILKWLEKRIDGKEN